MYIYNMKKSEFYLSNGISLMRLDLPTPTNARAVTNVGVNHIYCIDVSGSMSSELPKIRTQLKNRIPTMIKPQDTLSILWFSGRGKCGILQELVQISSLSQLQNLNEAIDRYLTPQGMTCFLDPIQLSEQLISRTKGDNLWSWIFLSDGANNDCSWKDVISATESLGGKIHSASIVEYGYYADSAALSEMAEILGGAKIFYDGFDTYEVDIRRVFDQKVDQLVELDITPIKDDLRYQFLVTLDDDSQLIKVHTSEKKNAVLIPQNTKNIYALSYRKSMPKAEIDQSNLRPLYALLNVLLDKQRYDVFESILYEDLGDIRIMEGYNKALGKQKLEGLKEILRSATFNPEERFTLGKSTTHRPDPKAPSVVDLLFYLKEKGASFYPTMMNYKRITSKAVVKNELSDEDKKAISDASTEAKIKQVLEGVEARKVAMEYLEEHPRVPFFNLTWNETLPNLSVLGKIKVKLTLPENDFSYRTLESFIWRNYSIIKGGILNVNVLPVHIEGDMTKIIAEELSRFPGLVVTTTVDGIYYLDMSDLPIISRGSTENISLERFFKLETQSLENRLALKYLKTYLPKEVAESDTELWDYPIELSEYLKSFGITEGGYSPKTEVVKSGDFYNSLGLKTSIAKLSALPSKKDLVSKMISMKPLTLSEMCLAWVTESVHSKLGIKYSGPMPDEDAAPIITKISELVDRIKKSQNECLRNIAELKFGLLLTKRWFTDAEGFDDNVRTVEFHDGITLSMSVDFKEEKVYL